MEIEVGDILRWSRMKNCNCSVEESCREAGEEPPKKGERPRKEDIKVKE